MPLVPPRQHAPIQRETRRRYIMPRHWQHVSARTQQGRYAFENFHPEFKARVWGYVGIANQRYGVHLAVFVLMGNHFHALIQARKGRRVSQWVQYVKSNLARLTHEFHQTRGTVWDGPYRHTNLLNDAAELAHFRYICSHGVKEGLTNHPGKWPGPNCIDALLSGSKIEGLWLDREAWRLALKRDPETPRAAFLRRITVELSPLSPGHRSAQSWRRICRETIEGVVAEHFRPELPAAYHSERDFSYIPETTKKSISRCFDARSESGAVDRVLLREAYDARRHAVEASIFAHQRMVERGLEAVEPPEGTQWTALVNDALGEEIAEAPFPWRPGVGPPTKAVA